MAKEIKREKKKLSNAKEPYKSGKKKHPQQSLRTDSLEKEDLSKVPKRSALNRKQSY